MNQNIFILKKNWLGFSLDLHLNPGLHLFSGFTMVVMTTALSVGLMLVSSSRDILEDMVLQVERNDTYEWIQSNRRAKVVLLTYSRLDILVGQTHFLKEGKCAYLNFEKDTG